MERNQEEREERETGKGFHSTFLLSSFVVVVVVTEKFVYFLSSQFIESVSINLFFSFNGTPELRR